jgi:dihydrofolate synthase/folylpolyglutamate synthase
MISEENVVKHCEDIFQAIREKDFDLRFFEIVTMIALLEFKEKNCEFAVLECGIGGHLDATNIVDRPVCSVITSIGLDHIDVIGDSIEAIASEKAGVIKANIPCIIGPTCLNIAPI